MEINYYFKNLNEFEKEAVREHITKKIQKLDRWFKRDKNEDNFLEIILDKSTAHNLFNMSIKGYLFQEEIMIKEENYDLDKLIDFVFKSFYNRLSKIHEKKNIKKSIKL